MNNINAIIIGLTEFPNGFAITEKMKLMAKIIIESKGRVIVLNRKEIVNNKPANNKKYIITKYNGIIVFSLIKKTQFFAKYHFEQIKEILLEPFLIRRCKAKDKKNILFLSYDYFPLVIYYWIISKLTGYAIVINIMEYHIAVENGSFIKRLNAKLFDRFAFSFADKAIVISNKLSEYVRLNHPKLPQYKLPVLADFQFNPGKSVKIKPYILYCGNIGYIEVIDFVLNVFDKIICETKMELYLVLHGDEYKIKMLKVKVAGLKYSQRIVFKSNLDIHDLYEIFFRAYCFVIPIRPNEQDEYRFPQKIAEYTLTDRPIITTNYGEIPNYFKDKCTAFISDHYNVNSFSCKLLEALSNPELASIVGKNAFTLGSNNFHYKCHVNSLNSFLLS